MPTSKTRTRIWLRSSKNTNRIMEQSLPRDLVDGPPPALAALVEDSDWAAGLIRASARVATAGSDEVAEAVKVADDAFDVFSNSLGRR
jgi:hypothetical protein